MAGTSDDDGKTQSLCCSKRAALKAWDPFLEFDSRYMKNLARLRQEEEKSAAASKGGATPYYANLAFGNPQDPPMPELVAALKRQIVRAEPPQGRPNALEYKMSHPETIDAIAKAVQTRFHPQKVDPRDDIVLTNGALAALSLSLFVLGDVGDEAILLTPKYFFYQPMAEFAGLQAVLVPSNSANDFDLDVEAIRRAISPKTRLVLLNSPNNPTGKIYPAKSLRALSSMLQEVNEERRRRTIADAAGYYHPIVVVSDEAYCRIVFDDGVYHSIAEYYPYSLVVYTWAKTLLCPSERFGYILPSPLMPESARRDMRNAFVRAQLVGWSFPNGTTMRAYADVENANIKIDISRMQRRRDHLYDSLRMDGWHVVKPQGGFYMLVQVPRDLFRDDKDLIDALLEERVLALPGSIMDVDGWIRLSLTASNEMIDFAIDAFCRVRSKRAALKSKSG